MKAKTVMYQKTFDIGGCEKEVIGVQVEIEEGEYAKDAILKAKKYVHDLSAIKLSRIEEAQRVVDDPDNYFYGEVIRSREIIAMHEFENSDKDDLPF